MIGRRRRKRRLQNGNRRRCFGRGDGGRDHQAGGVGGTRNARKWRGAAPPLGGELERRWRSALLKARGLGPVSLGLGQGDHGRLGGRSAASRRSRIPRKNAARCCCVQHLQPAGVREGNWVETIIRVGSTRSERVHADEECTLEMRFVFWCFLLPACGACGGNL